jgi:hypothetical protein
VLPCGNSVAQKPHTIHDRKLCWVEWLRLLLLFCGWRLLLLLLSCRWFRLWQCILRV